LGLSKCLERLLVSFTLVVDDRDLVAVEFNGFDKRQARDYSGFAAFAAAPSEPGLARIGCNVSMLL
jgi:hypothetical protein